MSTAVPSLPGYLPKLPPRMIRIKAKPDDKTIDIIKNLPRHTQTQATSNQTDVSESRILAFQGYFNELCNGIERPRSCQLNYFLNSNELNVMVKSQANSAIPPGTIIPRSVYTNPTHGHPYEPTDFELDTPIIIKDYVIYLVDCDMDTRTYYKRNMTNNYDLTTSSISSTMRTSIFDDWGKYHSRRNANKTFMEAMLGNSVNNRGREGFLRFGNNVLKFKLRKQDPTPDDLVLEFALVYYLADDTVEVFSMGDYNGNRSGFSKLLRRSKLPKVIESQSINRDANPNPEYYHWTELSMGTVVNVYNRYLRIVDTDEYTRGVYMAIDCPLDVAERVDEPAQRPVLRAIPPPTGFGSEEDSLGSCTGSLENRPPAMKVFGENKAYIFKARLANGGPDDEDREFVLTYYFVDGSVKVTEPVKRNSGFVGGVFMARKRVSISHQSFLLTDADMHTFTLMEEAGGEHASISTVLHKLYKIKPTAEALRELFHRVEERSGVATMDTLTNALASFGLVGDGIHQLSEHQLITIVRAFSAGEGGEKQGGHERGEVKQGPKGQFLYGGFIDALLLSE